MLTAAQLRAARALLDLSQRQLAEAAGVSVPTIRRMEASAGTVRANVDTLVKIIDALDVLGVELLGEGTPSLGGGRGIRLKQ
ncbi:MAG TPA: helix-turn-helix transcriptional regulator [Gammaproteobacteria bacterium]|nr:helix-turn-helix transcriptional regulator [Gammaproteobacteria bacterium]HRP86551.1 helix-turn-helix transcriptional regulator [Gammaproteobacteria bacterium]